MSELDKAISELVSAFQEIMPSAQAKSAAYWRQKYMETLAGQSIRTKTHDQERSAIANLQSQVRDLTETVQRKNREILALKETVAELRERNAKILSDSKSKDARIKELYDNLQRAEPPKMTTPLGLLPVNSTGMRRLADAYAQIASLADQSTMAEKNAALQKENDAYEALFRVLAETLREYDPKVKFCHPAGLS